MSRLFWQDSDRAIVRRGTASQFSIIDCGHWAIDRRTWIIRKCAKWCELTLRIGLRESILIRLEKTCGSYYVNLVINLIQSHVGFQMPRHSYLLVGDLACHRRSLEHCDRDQLRGARVS
ncbi:MAG: hypothetical protein ACLUUO_08140 [Sellimonas intestinalis]